LKKLNLAFYDSKKKLFQINWLNLTANVEIFGNGNNRTRDLPLIDLFGPIKLTEDEDQFDVEAAKIALDHLHFFLVNIW
jgi:hypothetical protein